MPLLFAAVFVAVVCLGLAVSGIATGRHSRVRAILEEMEGRRLVLLLL